jgi:hypothetical protein
MTATVVYDLDKIQDKHEFMMSMRSGEYVSLMVNFGYKLGELRDSGKGLDEAMIAYQSMLAATGIMYPQDQGGEEPLL